ncbi:MAG: GNAT family N-acetyltransferase [Oscillospiraceae bacterium]|nr:GNAT family N-acetyltransferase [Oscillospiraceae bacterium]
MGITYENNISAEDCAKLRASAGWREVHPDQLRAGLRSSAFIVAAQDGGSTVGMARLIYDGGYVAFIVDVLVLPQYQGRGIGKAMMERVLRNLRDRLKDGYTIQVDLMSAKGKEGFYEKFGFVKRPDNVYGCGMTQRLEKKGRA